MPNIITEKCTRCLKCEKDCPSGAISIKEFNINETCISCGHCVAICPESAVEPNLGSIKPLINPTITSSEFVNLSTGIRSCRNYLKKQVPEETIRALIENMKHYPSASNARPVHITAIQTGEKIQKLNDQTTNALIKTLSLYTSPAMRPLMKIIAPSANIAGLRRYKAYFIKNQRSNTSQICHHAPLVMLFHAPNPQLGMAAADAYIWATYTTIYANTLGLGCCFIGFIVKAMERNKKMREEFNIPAGHKVYAALTLGYPKFSYNNETSRTEPKFISV